jgi:hypothetical protein
MAIQIIHQSATADGLESVGPVGLPMSEPPCLLKSATRQIPGKAHVRTGLWECSLGKFRREIAEGEVMHILTGRCTFTPDSAPMIELRAGDTAFFPPDTRGIWEILRTVRKVYVLF